MGSPLIVATDIRNMTDIMKKVCYYIVHQECAYN